jgi:RNA recognition motif-containing protein
MEIYIFGIPESATENTVKELFKRYGQVKTVRIMTYASGDRNHRCFVEMPNEEEAEKAIAALNGTEFRGVKLTVQKARPSKYPPKTE